MNQCTLFLYPLVISITHTASFCNVNANLILKGKYPKQIKFKFTISIFV